MGLAGILIGMGSSAVMQTYLAVSLPAMAAALGGMSLYNWVFGVYMLASTVTIPLFARMADLIGRRVLYLFGLACSLWAWCFAGSPRTCRCWWPAAPSWASGRAL